MFRTLIPIFLYGLFVLVSSVSSVLFFFSILSRLSCSFVLRLSSLLCSPLQSSTSAPLLRPPLGYTVLSLLLSSPERLYSSSWFFLWLLRGLVSVRGLAAAPTVPVVTPPLFRPLRLLCPLLLRFVCASSYYPLHFFCIPHSRLLLPVFLYVFPCADAPAAPSRLPPCFFKLATAPAAPSNFPLHFHWLRLLLALCGASPVALHVTDFPGVVPHRSCFCAFRLFYSLFLVWSFTGFFPFSSPCPRAACFPSMSPLPRPVLDVFFAPTSVPPQPV